jgi:multisubunit Na+/H+ antiporter MnhG subunit
VKQYSKAIGATAGGGIGLALAILTTWILELTGIESPDRVESAIGVIFTWLLSVVGVYFAPANESTK